MLFRIKRYYLLKSANILLILSCFLIFSSFNNAVAQSTKFDSIFYNVAVKITDTDRALAIADSLYQNTPDKTNQIRALMLSADIYNKKGKSSKAISYATKANNLAEEINSYIWIARISGFISTQYRVLGVRNEGLSYLKKARKVSLKIDNENEVNLFQAIAFQEEAYYLTDDKKYLDVAVCLKKAQALFSKIPNSPTKYFNLAVNYKLLGTNNLKLSKTKTAKTQFNEALVYLEKASASDTALGGFIYMGLGRVYLKEKNIELAERYLVMAADNADSTDNLSLKIDVYKRLYAFYDSINNIPKYKLYITLYNDALEKQQVEEKKSVDKIVTSLSSDQSTSFFEGNTNYLIAFVSLISVALLIYVMNFKRKHNKRNTAEENRAPSVDFSNQENKVQDDIQKSSEIVVKVKEKKKPVISPEVEEVLLKKLAKFEKEHKYIHKDVSVASLSNLMHTNAKYLSLVIKKHRGKDFNSYINELRILYIVDKLKTEPAYSQYKISYLADECGFSSHSKFSSMFKTITNVTPSEFIERIK